MERSCRNCNQMLYHGHDYCPKCGSKWITKRLTINTITREFFDRYLGTDNVLISTFKALILQPEIVIDNYIKGQRKRFVNPINWYLISLTLIGLQMFILKNFFPELLNLVDISETNELELFNYFYDYLGALTSLFLPLYAFTGWLVFLDIRKYNFVEHLILFVYAFGLLNMVTVIFTPLMIVLDISYGATSIPISLISVIQIGWYYKRIFKLSLGQTVLKAILSSIIFSTLQIIFIIITAVFVLGGIYLINPEYLKAFKTN